MRRRRDPRAERQARLLPGGERPRLGLTPAAPASSERPRRDPRALRRAAMSVVGGRVRLDWQAARLGVAVRADVATSGASGMPPTPRTRIIADPAFLVLAVPDHPGGALSAQDREVIGAARLLADAAGGAVAVLAGGEVARFAEAGADRWLPFPSGDGAADDPEGRAAAVLAVITSLAPRHVLFPESASGGADLARRVAALAGERLFSGAETIGADRVARRMRGGGMEMAGAPPRFLSVAEGAALPHDGPPHEARAIDPVAAMPSPPRKLGAPMPLKVEASALPLSDADFILSGGNGVTDWAGFRALGGALGATLGGSRVVCDEGHLPRDRQVGASGSVVTARCYLAFGIAGAPQHLQGIAGVKHVVAVNTDLHAEMIKRADLAIVADAQQVMPALITRLRAAGVAGDVADLAPSVEARPCEAPVARPSLIPAARPKVAVLLSLGRHPASGRARRAPLDARALEMALSLPGADVHAIHAGDPAEPALRDYLGMGLERLTVLAVPAGADPVPALAAHLARLAPDIVLCGNRAEAGEDSGTVPYLLAKALDAAVAADIAAIGIAGGGAELTQILPRGKRRLIGAGLPVVAAVSVAAPAPRQSAYAKARRGIVETVPAAAPADAFLAGHDIGPWRARPRRMALAKGGSAADRLKAMTQAKAGEGVVMIQPAPEDAARAIHDYLIGKGIVGSRIGGGAASGGPMSDLRPKLSRMDKPAHAPTMDNRPSNDLTAGDARAQPHRH